MSKKLSILLLLMAIFVPWATNAQQTVTIGEATTANPTLPVHMVYSYSLTQQIYTAEEIGMAGNITSIAFYHNPSSSLTMENIQVYMMQVDKSVFASSSDIVPLTDATKVFEGTLSANGTGWVTLQLNTPFPYDAESNLLVCCYDPNSDKPGSSQKFNTTSTGNNYTSLVYSSNTIVPDVNDVTSYSGGKNWYKYRNNIQLVIAANDCQKPSTLEADGYTLTWTGGSGSYNVEYRETSETSWTRAYTNLAATTCTLTLEPNTDYEARVQSVCSGDEISGWKTVSFTTPCGVFTIDATHSWSEGFESYNVGTSTNSGAEVTDIRCWERVQINNTTHSPFVYRNYSTAASTGSASLELKTKSGTPIMVALPEFTEAIENLNVAFNYNCTSTGYTYTAELGYISDVTDASTFVTLFNIPKPVTRSTGHSAYSQDLYEAAAAANAPAGSRVAIKFATTTTSTPSWNLDDFVVSYVSPCRKPSSLSVVENSITTHNATLTWDAEEGATFQWHIDGTWNETQDNTVELTGLIPDHNYTFTLRKKCSDTEFSKQITVNFSTPIACPAPTNLTVNNITGHTATATWTGSSDGYNVFLGSLGPNGNVLNVNFANGIPSNWNNSSSYPWTVTADGHIQSGNAGVASSTSSISVTATFPASGTVEFDAECMGEGTSTLWDHCDFTIDGTTQFSYGANVSGWNHYTFNVAAGTHTFTWSYTKDGSVNPTGDYFAIDDVVMIASSIIWADPVYVENTEYTFTGLSGESRYFVKVQSNCGNEGVSAVVGPIAFDTDVSCMPPTNLTATNVNGNSAVLTWQGYGESYNVSYISTVFFEGFEDYSSQEVPTGWTVYKNGTTNSVAWSVYNPSQYLSGVSAHSGNNVAIAFSRPNNQGDNWLITPQLDLQGTLKFWVKRGTGDSRQDRYEVRLSTTGIDTVDFNVTLKPREVASDEWEEVVINLGDYEGQQGYIAIHHYHFGGYYLMVDDFSISGWVTASADTTSFVYEGLMPETEYQWKVQAQCGEDGESVWVSSSFTTLESCPTPIDVTATYPTAYGATLNWTGYSDSYTVKVGATTNYGFENNVISEDFTNSTTYPWTITTADKHSGTRCVKSASGFASANSDLKLTVTLEQAGTISFWEKVSSEASIDQGSFLIDNRTQYTTSGSTDWTFHSFELTSGAHTLTWRYYKNGSGDEGNDCFYVDDIAFTPWSLYTVTESPFILDDATHILPITTYTVIVQGNCGDEVSLGSAPISFTTACVPIANLPMSEDFNDYSTGIASATTAPSGYPNSHQLPHCWQFLNLSASTSTYPQAFLSSSSIYAVYDKCLLLKSSSQTPLYAILPEFEIATSTLQLTFTYRNEGVANTDGTLHVGYMTDPTVDSTFVSLYTCAKTTTKTTETVYFMNAPDDSYMVFKYQGGTSNGKILSIDDVAVEQIPSCFPVGTLSYDSLTSNTVNLSWPLVDTTQTAWQISVMTGDQEQFVNANSNENFLLDLSPATEYTLKVRAFCGGNDYGEWSNEITFTTLESCPTPTNVTYSNITAVSADISWIGREDVESYRVRYRPAEGIVARYMEDFNYDLDNWTMVDCESRTGILNGVFAFYRVTDVNNPNPHQYLISPELTSFITSNSVLEFKYRAANQNYAETFMVGFSSTNNEVESFSWGDSITVATTVYQTYHADLPAGTKYIAIQCISHRKYYLYIDDIIIGNEASVGQWMTKNTTETEAQLINLNGGTTYEVQVRSNCDLDSWSEMITFNTELDGTMVLVSEGDWNTASNWLPQGTPALNSKVILRADATVPSGCVAEANRILFEGTTLTINDGGQLKTNFNVNATMKKNITGYGEGNGNYYLMAVPINVTNSAPSNYITITAESNIDLYGWNRTATCEEWQNFKQNSFTLSNGEGYLFADSTDVELSFTGTLKANNVNETKNPDYDAASGGWNLYGNPFACDVYLTTEAEGMAFYRLIDTIFVAATGPIAPMEGFFAQATAAGQTFTITREAPAKCGQLNMSLNHNGSSIDNALIIFGEGQNLGKMSFRENSSKVYMHVNGKDCAAVFTGNVGEMPVNFVAKENGSFTLSFSNENVTFSYLHLIDTITGADVDLLQTPSYSFEARTTDNANRFKVVYTTIKH